ncbi:hypothetical protein AB3Z07_12985 [Metabacillus halosaccharovorans]|uniref:hypothetical protein n=1 Tax=Metabacillus halosaccharovorans TaxID=930124 RepID=UPI001473C29A|nr:hypothetical protein [Metabacillus halosaccharovorans]
MSKEQAKPMYYDGSGNASLSPKLTTNTTYIIKPDYDPDTLVKHPYFPYMNLPRY